MKNRGEGIKLERKGITAIVLTLLLLGMLVLAFNVQPAVAAHPWPMFRHDLQHTGRSPFIGAQTAEVKWTFATGGGIRCSPAIAEDGTIYIGSNDGNLYAINPDGTQKWSYPIGANIYSSPAIGSDGTIYVGSWRESGSCTGAVYAVNPNGTLRWRYPNSGYILDIESSPAIDPSSGVVYVGGVCQYSWAGRMYAINPDGTLKCEFNPGASGWMPGSPAVREDGKILIGDYNNPDGILWALNPGDCSEYDHAQIPNPGGEIDIHSSAAIGSDGKIYFGGSGGDANVRLWALNPNLSIAWNFPTGGHVPSSPAIGQDGTIYVGSYDDKLYAINPVGTEKWTYPTGGNIFSSPAVGADGTIYIGSNDRKVYAINSNGTLKWSYTTGGAIYSSPAIGSDSTVYVGSYDGKLYAFGTSEVDCQVSPTMLDFDTVAVGNYLDKTFTITNIGGGGTLTGSVTESCDHYSIVSGGGAYSLEAGESVVVTVRFEPASTGEHNCTIETGSDFCSDVSCTGVGVEPECQVSPTMLNFDPVMVGSYLDRTFTITNIGGGTLIGSVTESCDHYSIVSGGGPYSLGTGESVVVTVRFEPTSAGEHYCTIETGNALCSDVSCTGVGESPCQVSPISLDFDVVRVGSYLDRTFTITNIGEGTLTGSVTESCDHCSIVSGGGVYSLGTGEWITVTVRFEPASAGEHYCTIETGNDLCSDVSCTGIGDYWYWKPSYEDYAPSGIPDIDQKQDDWKKEYTQWTFCGPCAVANCFKWFDSKYNQSNPGFPGDGEDQFPLVRDYMDNLPPWDPGGIYDDHDPWNVDNSGTPWGPPIGFPPPSTAQPFFPGPQPQPSGMPAWGELVERLAWYFDTDGIRTEYCQHTGTNVMQMQEGIRMWLESESFQDGSTLADSLCEVTVAKPTFAFVESLVEKSENVILLLGFWYRGEPFKQQEQQFIRGDINEDGIVDLADVLICVTGGPFFCDDAADVNDDGILNMADCDYLTSYLYGGLPPPPPFPDCGTDPTPDELDCTSFPFCDWFRVGGHYVTVAGVNSEEQMIAFSDPFIDAAELGIAQGRVRDGVLIEHLHGDHDPTVHNDEGNVSHDMYMVEESPSPGGLWGPSDYPAEQDPSLWMDNFYAQNVPDEFLTLTAPWNGALPIYTEVEYAVRICPGDYRGDVQPIGGDGVVELGDLLFIINYLYKGGSAPVPYSEGELNCDGIIDLGDVLFLISYLYKAGTVPRCCHP